MKRKIRHEKLRFKFRRRLYCSAAVLLCSTALFFLHSGFLIVVVHCAIEEKDQSNNASPEVSWPRWIRENVGRIQHHQQNVERALRNIKHALQVNYSKQTEQQANQQKLLTKLWDQEGRRMGYTVSSSTATVEEVGEVEIRETGAISEVVKSEETESTVEPYIGMVFHVHSVDRKHKDGVSTDSSSSSSMDMYELLEPVVLELGKTPRHSSDYAYRPVGSIGSKAERHASLTLKPDMTMEVLMESVWWQWWFSIVGLGQKQQQSHSRAYERVGRAFAGGSHGEVWRGRRRCGRNSAPACDENRRIILKRLRIERGIDIMEAGLREIYVGNLLAREAGTEDLFTVYVDHFFRELPKPSFLGGIQTKELELWIVFEEAGASLRSFLYTPVSAGGFTIHQPSAFWTALRMKASNISEEKDAVSAHLVHGSNGTANTSRSNTRRRDNPALGKAVMREILRRILSSAAYLHERGMIHRDIKPSNVLCRSNVDVSSNALGIDPFQIHCVLGDFSSVWDNFTDQNLYSRGPSAAEQTAEYAPPEALYGQSQMPFHVTKPESYDSWSIGVMTLELLLGTPDVFTVDQRTTAVLTNKMTKEGASEEEIQRALYLAALSQFCIYLPAASSKSWPLRHGDPLYNAAMAKESCTLGDFHRALRARDPLGVGFDSSVDTLLHLVWKLLTLDPLERMTASEALHHPYFTVIDLDHASQVLPDDDPMALESLMLDPRMDLRADEVPDEFVCPKCGRKFADWHSCQAHATTRKHANFCEYDRSMLPTCLNAHSMLPAHPSSGYCDIQGRRPTIEDFHSIHLQQSHQFYGVMDGHTGNLASKYAASMLYYEVTRRLMNLHDLVTQENNAGAWKDEVQRNMTEAFEAIHENFLQAVNATPTKSMDQSGTTATMVYVTEDAIVIASVGDSRAIMASTEDQTKFIAHPLTTDHVASDPTERSLVEERGGVIAVSNGGLPRVNGTLAITRSIGDANLAHMLSRIPFVISMTRSEFRDLCGLPSGDYMVGSHVPCFLVLASDGLWDVMSNQEAIDMVADVVAGYDSASGTSWEDGGAFQEAAEKLTQEAYVRGSTDNIGVCVIAID